MTSKWPCDQHFMSYLVISWLELLIDDFYVWLRVWPSHLKIDLILYLLEPVGHFCVQWVTFCDISDIPTRQSELMIINHQRLNPGVKPSALPQPYIKPGEGPGCSDFNPTWSSIYLTWHSMILYFDIPIPAGMTLLY